MLFTVLELISQSSKFSRITTLRNGVFSPLFSKYVRFVWNKLCPPIKWLIFRRVWWLLILLTVLELISQSSNFARITILRNGVFYLFPPIFGKYVLLVRKQLYPPINFYFAKFCNLLVDTIFFGREGHICQIYMGKKVKKRHFAK